MPQCILLNLIHTSLLFCRQQLEFSKLLRGCISEFCIASNTSSVNLKENHNWKPQEIRETAILICYGSQIQERFLILAVYNSQDQKVPLLFFPPHRIKYRIANMLKQCYKCKTKATKDDLTLIC